MNYTTDLFVFEGPDGVGKSELASRFRDALQERGNNALLLSFPGREDGTIGRLVYDIHHSPDRYSLSSLTPTGLQALHIAAHLDSIERLVIPALRSGRTVVLDRYWWSTWVYGIVAGVSEKVLSALINAERVMWGKWKPSALFLMQRKSPLRPEPLDQWHMWVAAYDTLRKQEAASETIYVVENETTIDAALQRLLSAASIVTRHDNRGDGPT